MLITFLVLTFCLHCSLFNLPGSFAFLRQRISRKGQCENVTNITFLTFLPCLQEFSDNGTSIFEKLDSCDILTTTAVELAVERANQKQNVLGRNSQFLSLTPLHGVTSSDSTGTPDLPAEIRILQLTDTFRSLNNNLSELFGVIGPNGPAAAKFWVPIFQRSNLLTVSYDATNLGPEEVSTFYRTLPSDRGANMGRLALMVKFQWFRIATISSQEQYYGQMGEDFISLFNAVVRSHHESIQLALSTSLSHQSPDPALNDIRHRDINIIFGFFGPQTARNVLCRAQSKNLVSADHVWILPAYYQRNWWRTNSLEDDLGCSNTTMEEILESVIFINPVKIPPMDLSLDDFSRMITDKMYELFEALSLTEEDLKPYLLRSRAINAYDAVTLLARSVGVAFDHGRDNCTDTSVIESALANEFMECEYCRIHSGCSFNATELCQESCPGPDFSTPGTKKLKINSRNKKLGNFYGQVLYTQFTDGEECPVGIFWCFDVDNQPLNRIRQCLYTLEELDNAPCDVQLKLSRFNFTNRESRCPLNFQWQGSGGAPSSHHILMVGLPVAELIVIGLLISLGLVIAVAFLVFNVVWRQNKFVKASSPWINVILILGIIIRMPVSLLNSLAISTGKYGFDTKYIDPLCYFSSVNGYLGEVIFITALIAKNWRIYRIFNNHKLKDIGKQLADKWLAIGILIASLPVVITLVIMAAFNVRLKRMPMQNENLNLYIISYCFVDHEIVFRATVGIYNSFLLFCLLILTFLTSFVQSEMFRREARLSLHAVGITIIPLLIFTIALNLLMLRGAFIVDHIQPILWMHVTLTLLFPMLIMLVLFVPNIYLMIKEHVNANHPKSKNMSEKSHQLSRHYHNLLRQSGILKKQLTEYDQQITQLSLKLMQQEKTSIRNSDSKSITEPTNGTPTEKIDVINCIEEESQLRKHLKEDCPSFSSVEIGGSKATLITIVSDSILSPQSLIDKKLIPIYEEDTKSNAADELDDEEHGDQCKIFTLSDSDSN